MANLELYKLEMLTTFHLPKCQHFGLRLVAEASCGSKEALLGGVVPGDLRIVPGVIVGRPLGGQHRTAHFKVDGITVNEHLGTNAAVVEQGVPKPQIVEVSQVALLQTNGSSFQVVWLVGFAGCLDLVIYKFTAVVVDHFAPIKLI